MRDPLTPRQRSDYYAGLIASVNEYLPTFLNVVEPVVEQDDPSEADLLDAWNSTPEITTVPFTDGAFREAVMMWALTQNADTNRALAGLITRSTDTRLNSGEPDGGESAALSIAGALAFAHHALPSALSLTAASVRAGDDYNQFIPDMAEAIGKAALMNLLGQDEVRLNEQINTMRVMYAANDTEAFWAQFE